jgi:hypothetical protein
MSCNRFSRSIRPSLLVLLQKRNGMREPVAFSFLCRNRDNASTAPGVGDDATWRVPERSMSSARIGGRGMVADCSVTCQREMMPIGPETMTMSLRTMIYTTTMSRSTMSRGVGEIAECLCHLRGSNTVNARNKSDCGQISQSVHMAAH